MSIIKNIEVVSKTLPQTTNYRILNLLINNASWQLAYDNDPLSPKTFTEINGKKDLESGNVWNNKGHHHFVFSNFFYQFLFFFRI